MQGLTRFTSIPSSEAGAWLFEVLLMKTLSTIHSPGVPMHQAVARHQTDKGQSLQAPDILPVIVLKILLYISFMFLLESKIKGEIYSFGRNNMLSFMRYES